MNSRNENAAKHDHVFLGADHERNERRTWIVIWICAAMMALEIGGGLIFGSVALIADGLHMFTHAGALLLAALAYNYARRHAHDPRFTFGTGKLGDLAGFASAIVLAMISMLIAYEAIERFIHPQSILYPEAIAIACLGLAVNIASAWILGGAHPGHDHSAHGHGAHDHGAHDHGGHGDDESDAKSFDTPHGRALLEIRELTAPPRFHLRFAPGKAPDSASLRTRRQGGSTQDFAMRKVGDAFESIDVVPEPHAFDLEIRIEGSRGPSVHKTTFAEHRHGHAADAMSMRDNNMRAALVHVMADAAVSLLVILGLGLAWALRFNWIDALVGLTGAIVVASWAFSLARDSGAILLDMNPDQRATERIRRLVEQNGDRLLDLHVWRLGPGHLGAIVEIESARPESSRFYREMLAHERALSHLTIEVRAA